MEWDKPAVERLGKVPFFVRNLVRKRVEDFVRASGRTSVTVDDVTLAKEKFMKQESNSGNRTGINIIPSPRINDESNSEKITKFVEQVEQKSGQTEWSKSPKYYSVKVCGAPFGCPRALVDVASIGKQIVERMEQLQFASRIQKSVGKLFSPHHRFKIAIAGCPNACSEPQIKDFGLIGRAQPDLTDKVCIECMKCVEVCKEDAIVIENAIPQIDYAKCIRCGDCAAICPTGTICIGRKGYQILVGGKLGRHPQLGLDLVALPEDPLVLSTLEKVIEFYFSESKNGERLGNIISRIGFKTFRVKVGIPE